MALIAKNLTSNIQHILPGVLVPAGATIELSDEQAIALQAAAAKAKPKVQKLLARTFQITNANDVPKAAKDLAAQQAEEAAKREEAERQHAAAVKAGAEEAAKRASAKHSGGGSTR